LDLFIRCAGYANASWIGQAFQPSSDVYTVSVNSPSLLDHITDADTDTEFHFLGIWKVCVSHLHFLLVLHRELHSIHHPGKLDKKTISRSVPHLSLMEFHKPVHLLPVGCQSSDRVPVVLSHHAAVALD